MLLFKKGFFTYSEIAMKLLSEYPVVIQVPVAWGEMDALQHVNNAVYFRYFETARIEYFMRIKLLEGMEHNKVGAVLRDAQCQYKRPVTFPDTLLVGAKVIDIQKYHFVMAYEIASKTQNAITTKGEATVVMFDFNHHKKAEVSPELRDIITSVESKVDTKTI